MEVNQRRYRRIQRDITLLENEPEKVPEISKQELRKLLTERRNVIGPNGEEIRIPKHMAVDDIIKVVKAEYGLTTAEISGILVALKRLASNPEFNGKVNRVVASGIESPLRIERPNMNAVTQNEIVGNTNLKIENIETPDTITKQRESAEKGLKFEPLQSQSKSKNFQVISRSTINEEEYRQRSARINQIVADRFREEAAAQRREDARRAEQSKELEKQLQDHYVQQNYEKKATRKRIGVAVAALFAAMYVTGVAVDIANMTKQVNMPSENLTPLKMQTEQDDGKLFTVTQDTIGNFTKEVTPLVYTPQATQIPQDYQQSVYETFEYSIASVSKDLNTGTNLSNVLNKFSANSESPVVVGEIDSYQDLEMLLESGEEALYTSGPAYFANFSRQMLHGMLKDKYRADRVVATYEKTGPDNQTYEFNVRYYKDGRNDDTTIEGRTKMTRDENGRLQTSEYHVLPNEVYELLATIGEFSDFSNTEDGKVFDVDGYAARFTGGDVAKAREELKERMTYGIDAMKTLIKNRIREEQVDYYRYDR